MCVQVCYMRLDDYIPGCTCLQQLRDEKCTCDACFLSSSRNLFCNIKHLLISLRQFFIILIKKGRGIRPNEALATLTVKLNCKEGANSNYPP